MKKQITLRIDEDILAWFKSSGGGYQSRMNEALRSWMEGIVERVVGEDIVIPKVKSGKVSIACTPLSPDQFFKPRPKK